MLQLKIFKILNRSSEVRPHYYEYDEEHSTNEERFKIIGASYKERLIIVCHCVKENDIIRIFSAREADAEEKEMYYKTIGGKK